MKKALCSLLGMVLLISVTGCKEKKNTIAGNFEYEASIPVVIENDTLGIKTTEASLPVYLYVGNDNTFTLDLDIKAFKKDLDFVADDIEKDGIYTVTDVVVLGNDHYEGTYEAQDDKYVFSGDIEFTITVEDNTISADSILGETDLKFD